MCWDMEAYDSREKGQHNIIGENSIGNRFTINAISASWARCRDFGLRSSGRPKDVVLSDVQMHQILQKNEQVRQLVLPELELLFNQIAGTNFMVAYADSSGVVLDSIQDTDFQAGEGGKAVIPGSVWMEKHRGTNALGLALYSGKPQIVAGPDHFFHKLGDLSCFACPIFDHEENIVGLIDATSDAAARNSHTLALVKLASRNVENRLFAEQFSNSLILSFHARHEYLPTTSVGLIAVDSYGFIEGANANAKSMLSGLNLSSRQRFREVFQLPFMTMVDELRSNEIIRIRDLMGSVVFMTVQKPLFKRVLNSGATGPLASSLVLSQIGMQKTDSDTDSKEPGPTDGRPQKIFADEMLRRQFRLVERAMKTGLPINIEGARGTGKSELAREIHNRVAGNQPLVSVDANLLSTKNYENQLFGEGDRINFLENPNNKTTPGKLWQARGGTIFFDNADKLPIDAQTAIYQVMVSEDAKREAKNKSAIQAVIFSGPVGWLTSDASGAYGEDFISAAQGYQITIPPLSHRSDFQQICHALAAEISPQHSLSKTAIDCLRQMPWPGNITQLRKVLRLAIVKSGTKVIRDEIRNVLTFSNGDAVSSCDKCASSAMKMETCILIKKTWIDAGRNVSLASRRLGVSRNTIYKHIEPLDE